MRTEITTVTEREREKKKVGIENHLKTRAYATKQQALPGLIHTPLSTPFYHEKKKEFS